MEKKVLTNSLIYTISGLLLKCFSFFLLPLYTAYLCTADYGITSIANSFSETMIVIVSLGLFSAVSRFYVDYKDDKEKLSRLYGTLTVFVLLSSAFFGCLLTALRDWLTKHVFAGIDFYPVVAICLLTLVFMSQHNIYSNILISQQKATKAAVLNIAYFFVTFGLNILFVVVMRKGATGVLLSTLISCLVYTLYFWISMLRSGNLTLCIDLRILKEALKYSVPIMPHNLSTYIAHLFSKVLLGGTDSLASVGVYAIATQFATVADTVQSYINTAYNPWLFEKLHAKDALYKQQIRKTVRLLCALIGLFLLGLGLFSQDCVLLLLDKSYSEAWKYVPFIVMVYGIKMAYYFYVGVLFYYKKASRLLFVASITGSIVNVVLAAFLIPVAGVQGSIIADALSMLVRVAIIVIVSRYFEDTGIRLLDFVKSFTTVAVSLFLGILPSYIYFPQVFNWWNFLYKCLITFSYIAIVLAMYRKELRSLMSNYAKKRKG